MNASRTDQATITGNHIQECGRYAIQATDGSGHVISGNTFIDCGYRYVFLNGLQNNVLACSVTGNTFFVASVDRSAASSGHMYAMYVVNAGRQTITGNVVGPLPAIATPAVPTVTPQGTTGATTYSYTVTAISEYGETVASPVGSTATGNATLTGANFNRLTWTMVVGALGYRIYRTVGGATQGRIGEIVERVGTDLRRHRHRRHHDGDRPRDRHQRRHLDGRPRGVLLPGHHPG